MNTKVICYRISTAILVFVMLSGGVADLAHLKMSVEGMTLLGYPEYFMTILGFWKVLGGVALLVPRFPRLKEWAYAGVFFDVTGAAASHAMAGDYGIYAFHIIVNIFFAVLVVASWALRPESRILGILFPARTRTQD